MQAVEIDQALLEINDQLAELVGYTPHSAQQQFHASPARFKVLAAGSRFGKSMAAGFEATKMLLIPFTRSWCVSTQYELAEKEFDWVLHFLSHLQIEGRNALDLCRLSIAARGQKSIITPWSSFLKTKSAEKPQLCLGDELDLILLCEASQLPRALWERQLRLRIGPRNGRLIATSTPNGDGDLFNEFFEMPEIDPEWESWQFGTEANPYFSREELRRLEKELAEDVYREQVGGQFVSRRGHVFKFTPAHVKQIQIPETQQRMVGIHFQANNPIAAVFLAIFPETQSYHVYDEIYLEDETPEEVAREILRKTRGQLLLGAFCDYWDNAIQKDLKNVGVPTGVNTREKELGRKPATVKRIQLIQSALKIHDGGFIRLTISPDCVNTREHFSKCKWPDRQKEHADRLEKPLPLDKYLSLPMAISYCIGFVEGLGI